MQKMAFFLRRYPSLKVTAIFVVVIVVIIIWMVYRSRRRFQRYLEAVYNNPVERVRFGRRFTPQALMINTELIEEYVTRYGPEIITLSGLHEAWIKHFKRYRDARLLRKMIRYIPEKGLFYCLLAALGKKDLAKELSISLNQSVDLSAIQGLGLTAEALKISEEQIFNLLRDDLDRLEKLATDQEWTNRYFALKMFLYDESESSREILWEALADPHYLVRTMVLQEIETEKREDLYHALYQLYLSDPIYKVRKAAADRIHREFSDLYEVNPDELQEEQALHVLQLLRADSVEDENIALHFLRSDNLGLRLPAACYLEKNGILTRLATEVHLGDRENLERNLQLLENALQVNATSFLSVIETANSPGTLLLCAKILLSLGGLSPWTIALAKKTFSLCSDRPELEELYVTSLKGLANLKTEKAYSLINQELRRWRQNPRMMEIILSNLPPHGLEYLFKTLAGFLEDTSFEPRDSLRKALGQAPQFLLVPLLLGKLSEGERCPLTVRADAVTLLAEKGLPYGLQSIFESIPSLTMEESGVFQEIIACYPKKEVSLWVGKYLNSGDSLIRTALIRTIPPEVLGEKNHLQTLKQSLTDLDPDMRIAALHALVELKDSELLSKESPLFSDPVERVRQEYVKLLGASGDEKILRMLQKKLLDPNETPGVKMAIVQGMAGSRLPAVIVLLVECLEKEISEDLQEEIINLLAQKGATLNGESLVECFMGGTPEAQRSILAVVKRMDEEGLEVLVGLLKKRALRPHILRLLEESGWITEYLKMLRDGDPARRLKAAQLLAKTRAIPAYRGLIQRAKDKNEEIRMVVNEALHRLTTEDLGLLEELTADSDWRARRYARRLMKGVSGVTGNDAGEEGC